MIEKCTLLTIVLAAAFVNSIPVLRAEPQRPFTKFTGDQTALRDQLKGVLGMSREQIAQSLGGEKREELRGAVDRLIALSKEAADGKAKAQALAILAAALGDRLQADDQKIRAGITEGGAKDKSNAVWRDTAYDLARYHHLTGDRGAAHRAAVILLRLAEVVKKWPLISREGKAFSQQDKAYLRQWDANGLWGGWYYFDLEGGLPLVRAYDLIHASGAMDELGTGARERIEKDLLRHMADFLVGIPTSLGNLEHGVLRSLPLYGILIPEPRYVHITVQRYRWILRAMYYADGFWHEGAPGYHKDITTGLTRSVPDVLKGYSDPPGYTCDIDLPRYDHLDLAAEFARQHKRMWDALKKLTFPNKDYAKLHDAEFPHGAWWDVRPTRSEPKLLGGMGHAILGTNADPNQAQLHLHFSGTHGHEHSDCLNIILFAKGKELLSETNYRDFDVSPREWHTAAAGHNTVVIDEQNQMTRLDKNRNRRTLTPDDLMDGIPNWRYRDYGHGDCLNDGKLRCFVPTWDKVQMAEAEGERSYHPRPELYRRTVALIHAGEGEVYVVDIFRVRGGSVHDWMLHGCLQLPYELSVSTPLSARQGKLHKYLDELHGGRTAESWSATFTYQDGTALRTHLLGAADTEVIVGRGPAMRRKGHAQFLDVRRPGPANCFVAVHDPHKGQPNVVKVEPLAWTTPDPMAVALRVHLRDGRVDTILSTSDEPPFRPRGVVNGPGLTGRFAHIAQKGARSPQLVGDSSRTSSGLQTGRDGKLLWAYLVDGLELKVGDVSLNEQGWHEGVIRKTHRVEAADKFDAFETDAAVPAGLDGHTLIADYAGVLTQSFVIDRVERQGDRTLIFSRDEPGIEIRGDLIKMHYFPGWGIRGECRFRIARGLFWTAK